MLALRLLRGARGGIGCGLAFGGGLTMSLGLGAFGLPILRLPLAVAGIGMFLRPGREFTDQFRGGGDIARCLGRGQSFRGARSLGGTRGFGRRKRGLFPIGGGFGRPFEAFGGSHFAGLGLAGLAVAAATAALGRIAFGGGAGFRGIDRLAGIGDGLTLALGRCCIGVALGGSRALRGGWGRALRPAPAATHAIAHAAILKGQLFIAKGTHDGDEFIVRAADKTGQFAGRDNHVFALLLAQGLVQALQHVDADRLGAAAAEAGDGQPVVRGLTVEQIGDMARCRRRDRTLAGGNGVQGQLQLGGLGLQQRGQIDRQLAEFDAQPAQFGAGGLGQGFQFGGDIAARDGAQRLAQAEGEAARGARQFLGSLELQQRPQHEFDPGGDETLHPVQDAFALRAIQQFMGQQVDPGVQRVAARHQARQHRAVPKHAAFGVELEDLVTGGFQLVGAAVDLGAESPVGGSHHGLAVNTLGIRVGDEFQTRHASHILPFDENVT